MSVTDLRTRSVHIVDCLGVEMQHEAVSSTLEPNMLRAQTAQKHIVANLQPCTAL